MGGDRLISVESHLKGSTTSRNQGSNLISLYSLLTYRSFGQETGPAHNSFTWTFHKFRRTLELLCSNPLAKQAKKKTLNLC